MTSTSSHTAEPTSAVPASRPPAGPRLEGLLARYPAAGIALLVIGALLFGLLAVNVRTNGPLLAWDLPISRALHTYATHDSRLGFDAMRFTGTLGRETAAVITVVLLLYWLWKRHWHELSMLVLGVIGGNIWFEVLSNFFARHRPVFPDPLNPPLPGPGFPSGHSMTGMLLYGLILYLLLPRLPSMGWRLLATIGALAIVLLIGFSRLYMGDHYPTDVLGGYAFGLAWGGLVYTTLEVYRARRSRRPGAALG